MSLPVKLYHWTVYYGSLLAFFLGTWLLNVVCWVTDHVPFCRPRPETVRYWIFSLTRFYVFITSKCGTLVVKESDPVNLEGVQGRILVCNHPTRLDALLLLARDPSLVCIYKSSLQRMLLKKRTADMAGYISNDQGVEVIRTAVRLIESGTNLLVFPEGTRTENGLLDAFHPGYALAAKQAKAVIHPVLFTTREPVLGKGRHFLRPPVLPARYHLQWLPPIPVTQFPTVAVLNAVMESLFRVSLQPAGQKIQGFQVLTHWGQGSHWLLRIPPELPFVRGHFPENPIVPGYWILDALERFYDAEIHPLNGRKGWKSAKFFKPLVPGSLLHLEIQKADGATRFLLESEAVRCFTGFLLSSE